MQIDYFSPIRWQNNFLELIDQRLLPDEEKWLSFNNSSEVANAITDMVVRGAPAIGITAAYGVVLSISQASDSSWQSQLTSDLQVLSQSRPTAVNLFWALERMQKTLASIGTRKEAYELALATAKAIHAEDYSMNRQMAEYGAGLIESGSRVLTHCNTGALATGGHGTALGVIRTAWNQGKLKHVYANETRPWMQGSRLTAWELMQEGIPTTLQAESAAALLMQAGKVDWFICGADRIAANGDTANKIGTYTMALLAKQFAVKVMVVAPSSTVDVSLASGNSIPIEQRSSVELWRTASTKTPPENLEFFNPAFDVTPAHLIDVIVTEKGVFSKNDEDDFSSTLTI